MRRKKANKENIQTTNYIGIIISIVSSSLFIYSCILIRDFFQIGNYVRKKLSANLLQDTSTYILSIFIYILLDLLAFIIFACIYKKLEDKTTKNAKFTEFIYILFLGINLDIIIYQEIRLDQIGILILSLLFFQYIIYKSISLQAAVKIIETINQKFIWNIFTIILSYIFVVNFTPLVGYMFGINFQKTNYILNSKQTLILEYLDNHKAIVADYICKEQDCNSKEIIVYSSQTQRIIDLTDVTINKVDFKKIYYQ